MLANFRKEDSSQMPSIIAASVCAALLFAAASPCRAEPTEEVLYAFKGSPDGSTPESGLVADRDGNLYGTTVLGGKSGNGIVYKLTPRGTELTLHSFAGGAGDGASPYGSLIADVEGNLYGTTASGGPYACELPFTGCGSVFKVTSEGVETPLYFFTGNADGGNPFVGLLPARDGTFYGTTLFGGLGYGTIFKVTPGGTESVLYSFKNGADGANPQASLIEDRAGNLYGTTEAGGTQSCFDAGCGVVFKLAPDGTETVLYSFKGPPDGAGPAAPLLTDIAGNFYGTTGIGGKDTGSCVGGGCGTVFELTPGGTETVLHRFKNSPDGFGPGLGPLLADSADNLYGITNAGGTHGAGSVFKLTPGGKESVLYSFTGGADGGSPAAGLIADGAGNLYSTTQSGGTFQNGVIFKLGGTGFVLPFSPFEALLAIELGPKSDSGSFQLFANFTLGRGCNGIDPLRTPVMLQVGTFTTTIPAGSFNGSESGPYYFAGTVNGVDLEVAIEQTGTRQYVFTAAAEKADLKGTENPVPVTLAIVGGDSGTVSVPAAIVD